MDSVSRALEDLCENRSDLVVVVVPLPLQGHLNPLLHLSRLISAHKIDVYFVGSTTHVRQARTRLQGWDPSAIANLRFHDFPSLSSINASTLGAMIMEISTQMEEPLFVLMNKLSSTYTRLVLIFDSQMATTVQNIRYIPNAESYCFHVMSAFSLFSFFWEAAGKPSLPAGGKHLSEVPPIEGCYSPEFQEYILLQRRARNFHSGNILNTTRITEGLYLDFLENACKLKYWAIGPFNPVDIPREESSNHRHRCLKWLDDQPPNSVMYVSFGSLTMLSDEQVRELAFGLERSGHRFIWVLRDADKGDIFQGEARELELPEGYGERVKGNGIVIKGWAPQLEILAHPATGGFMSHCGWNSCMESISMGVPMATWPMHSEQPRNALLITKVLKIGVDVKDWSRRGEVVTSDMVEKAVKRLMGSAAEGEDVRKRAAELGDAVKKSMMEDGSNCMEMDSFIKHITR